MARLTIEIPDDLMEQLTPIQEQLPDLLRQCLHPLTLPAQVYRYVLDFLASQPTPEQIANFRPTADMQTRMQYLLLKNQAGKLSPREQQELDEYERIEHLIIMVKAGNLPHLTT
ncbi:MAG: hypothetical protein AAGI69_30945 [Cyanobacteria bacterium P01_H01_bin.21]